MPRCFVTGVEIKADKAYALDVSEAHRAMSQLKGELKALETLIGQLGSFDRQEFKDRRTGVLSTYFCCRLLSPSVAQAFAQVCPERKLFIPYPEWKELRKQRRKWIQQRDTAEVGRKEKVALPPQGIPDTPAGESTPTTLPEGTAIHGKRGT